MEKSVNNIVYKRQYSSRRFDVYYWHDKRHDFKWSRCIAPINCEVTEVAETGDRPVEVAHSSNHGPKP